MNDTTAKFWHNKAVKRIGILFIDGLAIGGWESGVRLLQFFDYLIRQ